MRPLVNSNLSEIMYIQAISETVVYVISLKHASLSK